MLRPKRKAAIKCKEKLHEVLLRRTTKNSTKNVPSAKELKIRECSVKLTKVDAIPQSMLTDYFTNRCSIKLTKSDADKPVKRIPKDLRNCVYTPIITNSQINSKSKRQRRAVKTAFKDAIESVYDFIPGSQNSQLSEDDAMKNVIKKLQNNGKVRVVKGRQNGKKLKNDFHKSWNETNIRKAKRIIKPKVKPLSRVQIIEVLKNDVVIPIDKPSPKQPNNQNESILPTIQDVNDDDQFNMDDDHFRNDDDFISDDNLNNSNVENINPNVSLSKQDKILVKPMIRSPLKPLNAKFVTRPSPSLNKDNSMQRKLLLKRLSLYNQSVISSNPRAEKPRRRLQINDESIIENANATNYFGFTSDLTTDPSIKISNEYTSTPIRPTATKESLIAKLRMLKASVTKEAKIKCTPRPQRQPIRSARIPIKLQEDTTINFSDALSSTLLQPEPTLKKNVRRTYSRQNKEEIKTTERDELFMNLIGEPVEQIRNVSLDDSNQKKPPIKKSPVKVYEKYKIPAAKQDIRENPKLRSFYQSFNMECEDVDNFKFIIE